MRDEGVVPGVAHRRIEKAVHHQRAGFLVHLVLDRLAADRHLDDDVDLARRIDPDRDGVNAHENSSVCALELSLGYARTQVPKPPTPPPPCLHYESSSPR